jgi:hypothetical protein
MQVMVITLISSKLHKPHVRAPSLPIPHKSSRRPTKVGIVEALPATNADCYPPHLTFSGPLSNPIPASSRPSTRTPYCLKLSVQFPSINAYTNSFKSSAQEVLWVHVCMLPTPGQLLRLTTWATASRASHWDVREAWEPR